MHENRETSGIPAVKPDTRTAGEGLGRTARMHISEESDSGTVPMNQSNKDEKLLAEIEEGRPLIEENTLQPNTRSTQSEASVSQGLSGVRKAARENKEMRFTSLLQHVSVDLLRASFRSLDLCVRRDWNSSKVPFPSGAQTQRALDYLIAARRLPTRRIDGWVLAPVSELRKYKRSDHS
jgi:hypothetical protein